MPRWRRPSVLAARQASSRDAPIAHVPEKFTGAPEEGHTRGRIGYRLVRVSSVPDEILGEEVGRLDRDDEVEILRMAGAFRLVRSPSGIEGWIHKTTLSSEFAGDEEMAEAEPAGGDVPSDWSPFGRMPSDQADPQRAGADEAPNLAKKAGRRSRAPSPAGTPAKSAQT